MTVPSLICLVCSALLTIHEQCVYAPTPTHKHASTHTRYRYVCVHGVLEMGLTGELTLKRKWFVPCFVITCFSHFLFVGALRWSAA